MGLSASQARFLMLTAKRSDLEYRAQSISQQRLNLAAQLESIAQDYESATSNRNMEIILYDSNTDANSNRVTKNLTYSNVVSGSYAAGYLNGDNNGIAVNSAYRVVDSNGCVVVASLDEIPLTREVKKPITALVDENSMVTDDSGTKYIINDKFAQFASDNNLDKNCAYTIKDDVLFLHSTNNESAGDACYEFKDRKIKSVFLSNNCQVAFSQNGIGYNVSYYSQSDLFTNNVTVISTSEASKITKKVTETLNKDYKNGVFTLSAPDNSVVAAYIVDPSLKSDSEGQNYFQDCLYNGKYLLQKTSADSKDDEGNQIWNSISWDATSEISDRYYTEDDAAAQAKYNRLQNQIQNRDKKLELELDNIETQRSAVTTELESVQKVIDDNIESSFKSFA